MNKNVLVLFQILKTIFLFTVQIGKFGLSYFF